MGKAFLYGSGGGGLNYALKPYATEAALLADSPKDNTIGVVTETALGRVVFSSTEPTTIKGVAVASGDVWIKEGFVSAAQIDIAPKDELNLYPTGVYQHNGTAWQAKTAYTRKSGAWVGLATYYYLNGDTMTDITGGWQFTVGYWGGGSAASLDPTYMAFAFTNNSSYRWNTRARNTVNKIDVTNISSIVAKFQVTYPKSDTRINIQLTNRKDTTLSTTGIAVAGGGTIVSSTGSGTVSMDVSSLTGSYYLFSDTWDYEVAGYSEVLLTEVYGVA